MEERRKGSFSLSTLKMSISSQEKKVFDFPVKSLWDIFKNLGEEKTLKLIELEQIRGENKNEFFKLLERKENRWIFDFGFIEKKKKMNYQTQYWQKMQRLGAFLRARPEFATSPIVNKMRETKTLKNFADIIVFKESASGVKVPLVPYGGYHIHGRAVALQKMEELYYTNLNYLLNIQRTIIKEIYGRTKGNQAELKKLKLKDLSHIAQRISGILDTFKKKQSSNILIKFNVAQTKREDYWRTYDNYIQENLKQ